MVLQQARGDGLSQLPMLPGPSRSGAALSRPKKLFRIISLVDVQLSDPVPRLANTTMVTSSEVDTAAWFARVTALRRDMFTLRKLLVLSDHNQKSLHPNY